MNLPNKITLLRIFLIPLIVFFLLYSPKLSMHIVAAIIFVLASLTDVIDGYIARNKNQVTTLGKLLDPIADKLLTSSALISLVALRRIPLWAAWIVVIIIGRDFCISGFRTIAATQGFIISASNLAKYKTIVEIVAILCLILSDWQKDFLYIAGRGLGMKEFGLGLLFIAMMFAVISGAEYFKSFWEKIDQNIGM
ncbi:MAG: CDP-diacylglycerol--glycerol-3-phosphate 3-phosphatidyltransferase [Candidatus Schekmanbacteria bacterium RBG_16_38_11]|uniref:CDP-diacylglycerol--glycerol-3-phosphate 3-phosphatidyltransferase n=1 Tax=Candidatus Schekmanbacteria bacterium RBG_16_38_11 TaxID=1817880 RepID=A0A1F7RU06_9BACT|nr:MAG: CDP-diacylglycerol--glycerol-3-phosphate 3-phosphatidyltransferase [Candidatus Schekmanbacteria bacterium RBG_16_38_11]